MAMSRMALEGANTAAIAASPPWYFGRPGVSNDRDITRFKPGLPEKVPF